MITKKTHYVSVDGNHTLPNKDEIKKNSEKFTRECMCTSPGIVSLSDFFFVKRTGSGVIFYCSSFSF